MKWVRRRAGRWFWGVLLLPPFQEQFGKGHLWFVGVLLGCPEVNFGTDVGGVRVIERRYVAQEFVKCRQAVWARELAVVNELMHFVGGAL